MSVIFRGDSWRNYFLNRNPCEALQSGAWGRTRTGMRYCLEGF